jgi:alkaline phosphatase D
MKRLLITFFLGMTISLFAQTDYTAQLSKFYNPKMKPFYYGVASGDPTAHSVVLWTKIEPEFHIPTRITYEIALDSFFKNVIQHGETTTNESINYTVTLKIQNLNPNQIYFYRFFHGKTPSVIGRTKTAPVGDVGHLKFAVVSCANFEAGYYNAYENIARRDDIDAVLHLGDYIYEYQMNKYGDKSLPRKHIPEKEITQLEDYRARYAQYRLDSNLQHLHQRHPIIAIWDDHEIANDSYTNGAENHQITEGVWQSRADAARQAYFEWMPVRRHAEKKIYRHFQFGNLMDLWMLDGRMEGRTAQAKSDKDSTFRDNNRSILGKTQFDWLTQGLAQSSATWRVLGNPVIMSSVNCSHAIPKNSKFMDMWEGYPAERERLLNFMEKQKMNNVVVVSGDSHTSWSLDLARDPSVLNTSKEQILGVEFATPSLTSANADEFVSTWKAKVAQHILRKKKYNPHLKFVDIIHHGYLILTLTPEEAKGEWFFQNHINRIDLGEYLENTTHYRLKPKLLKTQPLPLLNASMR